MAPKDSDTHKSAKKPGAGGAKAPPAEPRNPKQPHQGKGTPDASPDSVRINPPKTPY